LLHIGRVPVPFGTSRRSILTGINHQTRLHAQAGGRTSVVVSDARDATVEHADNLRVDYSRHCPKEYFTRNDVLLDTLRARVGLRRSRHGQLYLPAIQALRAQQAQVVLLHEGHFALPSVPYWRDRWPTAKIFLYVNTPLSRLYGHRELDRYLQGLNGCFFVSDWSRRQASRRIGKMPCPAEVIHNGVDHEIFHPRDRPDGDGPLRITFAGELAPHKGPQLLVEACSKLTFPYRLRIIGAPPDGGPQNFANHLAAQAQALGVRLTLEPRLKPHELAAAFRTSDVVVVPSIWPEPFGRVAPEAMACGAAVISSTWGGLPEVCGNGALLVDPTDIAALTDALRSLEDPASRSELSRAGLHRAQELSWENSYRTLIDHLSRSL